MCRCEIRNFLLSTEIRRFDTTCQIVHLAPSDLLNGGKGPLLG